MTGRVIYRKPKKHECRPPVALCGAAEPIGSIWQCDDCGRRWIVNGNWYWRRKWLPLARRFKEAPHKGGER